MWCWWGQKAIMQREREGRRRKKMTKESWEEKCDEKWNYWVYWRGWLYFWINIHRFYLFDKEQSLCADMRITSTPLRWFIHQILEINVEQTSTYVCNTCFVYRKETLIKRALACADRIVLVLISYSNQSLALFYTFSPISIFIWRQETQNLLKKRPTYWQKRKEKKDPTRTYLLYLIRKQYN